MASIGVVGAGISGLTLALTLQQRDVDVALYTERSSDEMRLGRLPNTVLRYGSTIPRERALGVDHWDAAVGAERIYFSAVGAPIAFDGAIPHGGSGVDFRLYLPQLLEDFEERGGRVVVGPVAPSDVAELSTRHDVIVIASGRDTAAALFPRDDARSEHTTPQRRVCAGIWHGVDQRDPAGITYSLVPGIGEIFQMPFASAQGDVSVVLFEAVPGGPLDELVATSYDADPAAFTASALRLVGDHAPGIRDRVDAAAFALTGPLDLFQGAVTPMVRRTWCELPAGGFAVAVGDAWVANDPVTGQGANLASACAAELASAIVEQSAGFDESFCRDVDRRLWQLTEPVCRFTNAFLAPPPPHVLGILAAASQDQRVADAFAANFSDPRAMWDAIGSEQGAAAFLAGADRG